MKAPLTLLPKELRSLIMKRRRQREWARKDRAARPEVHLERVRRYRKRLVAIGYYRKGGKGYSNTPSSEKRKAYYRAYYQNVRKARDHV